MVTVITRKPPPKRTITSDVRALRVGQSVKTDETTLLSARVIASRVKQGFMGTAYEGRSFNVTSRDGFIYITRVS